MSLTKTFKGDTPQRLNKWMAQSGICSRREAEGFISAGLVQVDNVTITELGHKICPGETLTLSPKATKRLGGQLSVIVHKPVGIVSAQPEPGQVPAARLLTRDNLIGKVRQFPTRQTKLAPLGRLDRDSRGLLILSEDGVLAKALIGPESTLEKEYLVRVAGSVTQQKLDLLRHGLSLDGRRLKPAKVAHKQGQVMRFILREGRNRQIRRMAELVDLRVIDLLRLRIGSVKLGALPEGKWRVLEPSERAALIRE